MLKLDATKRDTKLDVDKLRKEDQLPAVFYGPKEETTPINLKLGDFLSVYDKAGESSVIILKEGSDEHEVLVHDVQIDAVSGLPVHVDFYVIEKGKKINVAIPLEFIGIAPAEKNLGGVLVKVVHELDIEVLPKDLPQNIEVSLESLVDFQSQIKAQDLVLPEGVELDVEPDEVIALVQEPKEEEPEPEIEPSLDDIEVEQKGKDEDGEEGGEGGEAPKEGGDSDKKPE